MLTETEVAVTSAFLSLALAIHHAKHVYISESQMAEELGLEKPADWFSRCDTLFTKTYPAPADAIGLKRNRQTLVYLQIPEECLTTEADKLPTLFAFDPWLGMGRGGIKRLP